MGTQRCIRIEVANPVLRYAGEQLFDVVLRVGPGKLLDRGNRRVVEGKIHVETSGNQAVIYGTKPLRRLGVMLTHIVKPAVPVRDECGTRHKLSPASR